MGIGRGALVGLLLLAGCSAAPEEDPAAPDLTFTLIQQRYDEGTSMVSVRVRSDEETAVQLSAIGLDWSGYGGRVSADYATTIDPGETVGYRVELPAPTCDAPATDPQGVAVVDGTTVVGDFDARGAGYLTRVHQRACDEEAVRDAVTIRYAGPWRRVRAHGWDGAVQGRLVVRRAEAAGRVEVGDLTGSVLVDLHAATAVLPASEETVSVPIVMTPARCDAHALGGSSQTFVWRGTVRIDDDDPRPVYVQPDRRTRAVAEAMVRRLCG